MKKVDIRELMTSSFAIMNFVRELRFIAEDDVRGSIRNANEARKNAIADLEFEGLTAREANAVLKRIEKHFGLNH